MTDGDIRALQVKMLTEDQLVLLHNHEAATGTPLDMGSFTAKFRLEGIKSHYRVTSNTITRSGRVSNKILREWAGRVRAALDRFSRETGLRFSGDIPTLHAFDKAVWASDLDFYHRTVTAAKRATGWRSTPDPL